MADFSVEPGAIIGRLTITDRTGRIGQAVALMCRCECGGERLFRRSDLKAGKSRSCGCLQRELAGKRLLKHGHTIRSKKRSPEYGSWACIINRCTNEKTEDFLNYGGRGITVCERWTSGEGVLSGFECFLLDMGPRPAEGYSVERRDNDAGYGPENCMWATRTKQSLNKRNSRIVTWRGREMHLFEACKIEGMRTGLVAYRLQYGWPLERALTEPVNVHCRTAKHR